MIVCQKCGTELPDDSTFCIKCGEEVIVNNSKMKKFPKGIKLLVGGGLVVVTGLMILNFVGANQLKADLNKTWYASSESILKVLEFSDDEVEYRLETGYKWMDTTLVDSEYKVISSNKIKVERISDVWEEYTIEFNDDKTRLTISPAFTSTDDEENWYYIDY